MREVEFWGLLPRDWQRKDKYDRWQLIDYLTSQVLSDSRGHVRRVKHLDESVVRVTVLVESEKGY